MNILRVFFNWGPGRRTVPSGTFDVTIEAKERWQNLMTALKAFAKKCYISFPLKFHWKKKTIGLSLLSKSQEVDSSLRNGPGASSSHYFRNNIMNHRGLICSFRCV